MTTTKPSDLLNWIPDNTTNIFDPGSLKTNGYPASGATAVPKNIHHNWLFNRTSQWVTYLNGLEPGTFYVDYLSGSDTNDGTISLPYKTIKHCIDTNLTIGGNIDIYIGSGTHEITADITLENNKVVFRVTTAVTTAELSFSAKDNGDTTASMYGFKMNNSSVYFAARSSTKIDFGAYPALPGATTDWYQSAPFRFMSGNCTVYANCTAITFNNSGTLNQFFVYCDSGAVSPEAGAAIANVHFLGSPTITTNSKGFVVANLVNHVNIFGALATIDNSDYWVVIKNQRKDNAKYLLEMVASGGGAGTPTGGTFQINCGNYNSGSQQAESPTIVWNASQATVISSISTISLIDVTCKTATVTYVGSAISTIEFEVYRGSSEGVDISPMIGDGSSLTGGTFSAIRMHKFQNAAIFPPTNITTNIDALMR